MPLCLSPPDVAALPCLDVVQAAALRVRVGVNAGDTFGSPEPPCPGDVYRMEGATRPLRLTLTDPGPDGLRRIGPGSGIGAAGDPVATEARHLFMADDGSRAEVLVLRHHPQGRPALRLLMPLQPIPPGIDHILIATDHSPAPGLPDQVCGAIARDSRVLRGDGTPCPVEALRPGDPILTRDHGAQPLRWSGQVTLRAAASQAPVVVARGVLGNADDLVLSQQTHLFFDRSAGADLSDRFMPACQLLGDPGIRLREGGFVDYSLLVFDRHEIVYVEGVPVESLRVADATVARLPQAVRHEVKDRFPGVNQPPHHGTGATRPRGRVWDQAAVP